MSPIVVDICFLLMIFISALIAAFRGFFRSVLSVLSWVAAIWITWKYTDLVLPLFDGLNQGETVQAIAAHISVFFAVLLVTAIISTVVSRLVIVDSVSRVDRTMGFAFGIARGVAIVLIFAVVGSFAFILEEPWWRDSLALAVLEPYVFSLREMLSEYVAIDSAFVNYNESAIDFAGKLTE